MWVLNNTVERAQGLGLYRSEFKSQLRLCLTGKPFSLSETYKQFHDLQNELHTTYFGLLCRLQTMHKEKVWKNVLVAELCLTPWDPMGCSPPGFSVHVILQARILEWVAIPFSRGFSWPRDQTWVSCISGRFFTTWATKEAPCRKAFNITWTVLRFLTCLSLLHFCTFASGSFASSLSHSVHSVKDPQL